MEGNCALSGFGSGDFKMAQHSGCGYDFYALRL